MEKSKTSNRYSLRGLFARCWSIKALMKRCAVVDAIAPKTSCIPKSFKIWVRQPT